MTAKTEEDFLENIDKTFVVAAQVMELADLNEGISDEEMDIAHEARHHCGTCEVRTVMEIVWPAVEEYINWLKEGSGQNGTARD